MTPFIRASDNTAIIGSFEAIFALMFGPQPHDAHVVARRRHLSREQDKIDNVIRHEAMIDYLAEFRERESQKLAATHGYDTAALRRELHRYEAGCFSKDAFAATTARQLRRALDIAIERRSEAA